jgi:glycosyltransferase involved in cell wall biosynthesis
MHRLLVNALSVTNQSGLHVLLGHMDQVADALAGSVRLVVLCRRDMDGLRAGLGDRADWVFAPASTRRWLFRAAWERLNLARLARGHDAALYFTPSGIAAHLPPDVKQIVFCQNPWALVPAARRRRDAPKAGLQRRAYRRAMRVADAMVFNSRYMQEAYRANAGFEEQRGLVVHQAAADSTRACAAALSGVPRKREQILCVSAMAPHKNVETLVRAFALVRATHPDARLVLAGSWPDPAYERQIRALVAALGLEAAVEFTGFIAREPLDRLYAESRVFGLMSRCESFGIPAIEAQLFGTPVVTSTVCAMPEIGGAGGLYCDPDDVEGIAAALSRLLDDDAEWRRLSGLARQNAERFAWARCSRPLVDLIAELAAPAAPKSFPCCGKT